MQRAQQNPTDPPGTPPASSSIIMHDERSDNRSSSDLNTIYSGKPIGVVGAPKKIPSAFNRTRPTPTVAPRVLFPPQQNFDGKIPRGGHKSPPSVRRRSQEENTVFLWELEDEDDIPSDSSAEHHVVSSLGLSDPAVPLSGNVNTQKERGKDATSDPGYNYYSRVTTYPNTTPMRQKKSSSDAAGPTSSSSFNNYRGQNNKTHIPSTRWGNSTTNEPPNGNIPQSPDEHTARLKEIMDKRDKKKRKKKKRSNHNADDSDDYGSSVVSGLSSNTRTSSNVSSYADDPINYLNEMLHSSSEKKKNSDAASAVSRGSKGSAVSSLSNGSKTSSKASYGSDVSGGSNTSSIFASTRAKLKGYLTSYKKKDKKDIPREPNKSTKAAASPFSPARGSPSAGTQTTQGTPSTLFSIDESEPDSTLKQTRSNNSLLTPARSGNRKSFEEKILHLSTPPTSSSSSNAKIHLPRIHCAVESDTTTQVISLPWSHDSKDASIDDTPITGLYSGPVNELLQPHGTGKLVLEGNNSSLAFYGTWEGGKLVSPLTDEKEPVTDDEDESDEPFPDSPIRRTKGKPMQNYTSATPNNSAPPVTSIKYAVNSHNCKISMDTAITSEVRDKAAKKRRKQIMPLVRYDIGDACRTPQDMIICRSKHEATESAGLLQKWDGAFIKRSCGVWTYAVLIERALQPMDVEKRRLEYFYWATVSEVDPCHEMEDSMLFAIDEDGSTKIIPKRAWSKYIRRIQCNPVPNIPRDPLPTEVTTKPSSQEEHSSCNDSGFDGKFASLDDSQRESKVYPC